MKRTMISRIVLAGACMALGQAANADAGWSNYGLIGEFNQSPSTTPGSEMVFITTTATSNPSGCSGTGKFYFPVTTELQKRMYSMLLAAKLAEKRVQIYVTGICHIWGYAEAQGAIIE